MKGPKFPRTSGLLRCDFVALEVQIGVASLSGTPRHNGNGRRCAWITHRSIVGIGKSVRCNATPSRPSVLVTGSPSQAFLGLPERVPIRSQEKLRRCSPAPPRRSPEIDARGSDDWLGPLIQHCTVSVFVNKASGLNRIPPFLGPAVLSLYLVTTSQMPLTESLQLLDSNDIRFNVAHSDASKRGSIHGCFGNELCALCGEHAQHVSRGLEWTVSLPAFPRPFDVLTRALMVSVLGSGFSMVSQAWW